MKNFPKVYTGRKNRKLLTMDVFNENFFTLKGLLKTQEKEMAGFGTST